MHRHALPVRIAHWINLGVMVILLASGLQIFNAHPALYWGDQSNFTAPLAEIKARDADDGEGVVGEVHLGRSVLTTTGFLGVSTFEGEAADRAFPAWATLPGAQDLGLGRRWHFLAAWIFVLNGLVYLVWSLARRHVQRDLWPTVDDVRSIGETIRKHAMLRFPQGEGARRYNVLQKLSYLLIILVALPLMVLTGLSMSPRVNAQLPWLVELFDGRQSARTIHFLVAGGLFAFVVVHMLMVIASGFINGLRSMITGRFAIEVEDNGENTSL